MSNICILGDGLLGSELENQTNWDVISRKRNKFDITHPEDYHKFFLNSEHGVVFYSKYKVLVNCIANTDTYTSEKEEHWDVNFQGVKYLIDFCNKWKIKLIHISTDYIFTHSLSNASENTVPVHCATWYGYTKLVADALVQLESNDYLLIRTTHKPKPFPYKEAWEDQVGNFDYVDIMTSQIVKLIKGNASGVFNIGTERKSMYDLAQQTNLNIKSVKVSSPLTPKDVTMDTSKYQNFSPNDFSNNSNL